MNAGALIAWLPGLILAAAIAFALVGAAGGMRAIGAVLTGRRLDRSKVEGRQAIREAGRSCN